MLGHPGYWLEVLPGAKRKGLKRCLARWKSVPVRRSPAVRSAAGKFAVVMQKTAKAVTKHSAQLATGSTFAKKKAAERASATRLPTPQHNIIMLPLFPQEQRPYARDLLSTVWALAGMKCVLDYLEADATDHGRAARRTIRVIVRVPG